MQVGGVEQSAGLPGLLQDRQHDLIPQGRVQTDNLLDVAEQLGGLHLRQQAALLQVQQPAQEQLYRVIQRKQKLVNCFIISWVKHQAGKAKDYQPCCETQLFVSAYSSVSGDKGWSVCSELSRTFFSKKQNHVKQADSYRWSLSRFQSFLCSYISDDS